MTTYLDGSLEAFELRLSCDVTDGTGRGARTEQGALWPAQHFEALEIEQFEIGREQGLRDRRFVQVHAD